MKRLSTVLALLALAAQLALPVAHEWQVARQEADHPHAEALAAGGGSRLSGASESGHSHHDEDLCRLCPTLARLRLALLPSSVRDGSSAPFHHALSGASRALARAPCLGQGAPRGPPPTA